MFEIGPARIGAGQPVYVIAEAGVNHDGDPVVARELIHAAAEAEADAVKFQVFSARRLTTSEAPCASYQSAINQKANQQEMLRRLELSKEAWADLFAYAGQCGIEFLATPFSVEDLELIVSLGGRAIKLASTDLVNPVLAQSVGQTHLPVIASTGAADEAEIEAAVGRLREAGVVQLALLHCVSCYPTKESDANLARIGALAARFGCVSGFSDHTESEEVGAYAVAAGARILEKHFTLGHDRIGPDHSFSLEPQQLARYIHQVRRVESMMGTTDLTCLECEQEVRHVARGKIVSRCDIQQDQVIEPSMLTIKRAGTGIGGEHWQEIIGRKCRAPLPPDVPIDWDMLT
jgi:sialic acid synthase SpsE